MNEFNKLVDEAIEEAITPPLGSRGKKVYTIPTKRGPISSKTDKRIADVVKSGDLEDVPYSVQATGPLSYSYSTEAPKELGGKVKMNILPNVLELSNRWFDAEDIEDAWKEFKNQSKVKTMGVDIPTNADKEIVWNLFYDLMLSKIKPLRVADKEAYDRLMSLSGKGLEKEILRPANRRLVAMVEGRKGVAKKIRSGLRKMKQSVIDYVFPAITESVDRVGGSIEDYAKALKNAYDDANYDFTILKSNGENDIVAVNLIKNYRSLNMLAPGLINKLVGGKTEGGVNPLTMRMKMADSQIYNSVDSFISKLEKNLVIRNVGWKFDRSGLKSAITFMDGSAPAVFKDQFVNLIEKLPYLGTSRENAERIYDLLVSGYHVDEDEEKSEIKIDHGKSMSYPVKPEDMPTKQARGAEEDPTLFPSTERRSRPVPPKNLVAGMPAYGDADKRERENLKNILRTIKDAVDKFQESYYMNYVGTEKLAKKEMLEKDPSRERPGMGARTGVETILRKIMVDFGITDASVGEMKTSLMADSNKDLIPNMVIGLAKKAAEIKNELIDPWIASSGVSDVSEEGIESGADYIRSISLPDNYSRYANAGREPILAAYNYVSGMSSEKEKEAREYESEEEIMSLPKDLKDRRKMLWKFRNKQREKGIEELTTKKIDNLANIFLELAKYKSSGQNPEMVSQLKIMLTDEMSKILSVPTVPKPNELTSPRATISQPVFSRMARKLASMEMNNQARIELVNMIVGLISEINNKIDPELSRKLVFASISNGDWEALDVLTGIRGVGDRKSVDGLIKAAASTGDEDIIAWAIEYIKNIPNPPIVSLGDIAFEKPGEYSHYYGALKEFGLSNKMAVSKAIRMSYVNQGNKFPKDWGQRRKAYNRELYDIIQSYGKDAMIAAERKIEKARSTNPKIDSSAQAVARRAILDSGIKPKGSEDEIQLLNPMGYKPGSPQYDTIVTELVDASKPSTISAYEQLQNYERFKDIPVVWKAGAPSDKNKMINTLTQKLNSLIKELAAQQYNMAKKSKGRGSSDIKAKLPAQVKMKLRSYGLNDNELNTLITHNTIALNRESARMFRDNADDICEELVSVYRRLQEWTAKATDDEDVSWSDIEADEQKLAHKSVDQYPYSFGLVGDKIIIRNRASEADKGVVIDLPGIDGDKLHQSFQRHMKHSTKGATKTPFKGDDNVIEYYLDKNEMIYVIGGLKPSRGHSVSNIEKFGPIIGMTINKMEEDGQDTTELKKVAFVPVDALNAINKEAVGNVLGRSAEHIVPIKAGQKLTSAEIPDTNKTKKRIKQLKTEIENMERHVRTSDMTVTQKQKYFNKVGEKREQLRALETALQGAENIKAEQEVPSSSEIERLIEAKPEAEEKIRELVKKGWSFSDILEVVA